MKCKLFVAANPKKLEDALNEWLTAHIVAIERLAFSCVAHDDRVSIATEYVCVLFYTEILPG